MAHLTRRAVILGGIGVPLGDTAVAKRRQRSKDEPPANHDAILSDLAGRMVFGVRDEGRPLEELEANLSRGETVEALCGIHAHLAVRELRRLGITSRRVGALREPYGPDNSHVLLEVRVGGAWQCYDVMGNTQAIDGDDNGLSIVAWCAASERHWRRIATDPNWPRSDEELSGLYERVLGTPWVEDGGGFAVFHDLENAEAITTARPWLHPVDLQAWLDLLA
jgi:hypothetical protein